MQQQNVFGPTPRGPVVGSKDQIALNYITKSISKNFIPNVVCVLTIKDIKHIEQDFCSDACVMSHGRDLGASGMSSG